MVFVLLEHENNQINPVIPKISEPFNVNCIVQLMKKVSYENITQYKKPPLFENGWFLIYPGDDTRIISYLCRLQNNVTVIMCYSRSKSENILNFLTDAKIEYRFIDNFKVSKEEKLNYIRNNLKIDESDVTYLYNRTRGYLRDLTNAVTALKHLDYVTRNSIKSIVPKTDKVGLNDLYEFLIGTSNCKASYEEAIQIINRYRYGFDFLREFLLDKLQIHLLVYDYTISGELTIQNYRDFHKKELSTVTTFQLGKIVEQFKEISYEYLYFLFINISKLSNEQKDLIMLINIFRLRKES